LMTLLAFLFFATTTVIEHVTVIDTVTGALRSDVNVVMRDGRIASVERTAAPKDARRVDGRGRFLIPGLWDMHVHLSAATETALPLLLANGVTGVRDMGGKLRELDEWRVKIEAGVLAGPRIVRVGPTLNGQQFNALQMVPGTPEETRGVVRALKAAGVDFIKVHRRVPRDVYFALIDEANKQSIRVVGHIPIAITPEEASDAGQLTIEHTETLFEGTFAAALKKDASVAGAIGDFRANAADGLFARFVKNGNAVTPTLVEYRSLLESADPSYPPDPRRRYLPASLRDAATKRSLSGAQIAEAREAFEELKKVVGQMSRAGVVLLAGSDIANVRIPGFDLHDELALLVESGLTPLQAVQAATLNPAHVMKKDADFGSVEVGKIADLLLLDANPLADIHATTRIFAVVFNGRVFPRAALKALLKGAEELAAKR
ncbi:MAG TPA: amidohydrolase family protein, partial [Thermoanaerobaculia bacterium]|nr:amidohydrolase family protein [Thermoanaerobaculia bacterium]